MTSLGMKVLSAHAGSDDGQFPILDLLRNLRDVAGQHPALEEFCAELEAGRERMVAIVKRAEPFGYADIMWLRGLLDLRSATILSRTKPMRGSAEMLRISCPSSSGQAEKKAQPHEATGPLSRSYIRIDALEVRRHIARPTSNASESTGAWRVRNMPQLIVAASHL